MKIKFDYINVEPDDVKIILEYFYKNYKDTKGTDGQPIKFGKLSLYLHVKNQTDDEDLCINNKNGNKIIWEVKNREIKDSKKPMIGRSFDEESGETKLAIYESSSNNYKNRHFE